MSFDCITEGSKDYIKYVLQLSEASISGVTYVAPGRKKETKKNPFFTFSGGAGGKSLRGGDKIKPGRFISKNKEDGDKLRGPIIFGSSAVPGVIAVENGKEKYSTQGGLDYLTNLSQAQSAIEFANQMLPAAVKLALAGSLFQTSVGAGGKPVSAASNQETSQNKPQDQKSVGAGGKPVGTASNQKTSQNKPQDQTLTSTLSNMQGGTGPASEIAKQFSQMGGDVIGTIENLTGVKGVAGASPLASKVMKATKNLGALDPFNPLLGLQLGIELLGGKEVLRRTREIGAAQSAGAASSMGHPSGFRGY